MTTMTKDQATIQAETTNASRDLRLNDDQLQMLAEYIRGNGYNWTHYAHRLNPWRKWCPCSRGECVAVRKLARKLPKETHPILRKYAETLR
jgi:hypothetical protein